MDSNPQWYALTVKHQHERRAAAVLAKRGVEALLPLYKTRRRWSDRVKQIEMPLFSGYLFCRFSLEERIRVVDAPGVGGIVSFGGHPAAVENQEIENIRRAMNSKAALHPWPRLEAGDLVRIEKGPLAGLEGPLLRTDSGVRIVLGIQILQRAVAVEVEPEAVRLIRRAAANAAGAL
jgi:transcription antitermination factor NusG